MLSDCSKSSSVFDLGTIMAEFIFMIIVNHAQLYANLNLLTVIVGYHRDRIGTESGHNRTESGQNRDRIGQNRDRIGTELGQNRDRIGTESG